MRYPMIEGVPVVLANGLRREEQLDFFDDVVDREWEVMRPHGAPGFHGWLLEEKLRRGVQGLDDLLKGGVALSVCGGSGMDAEYLARRGARVLAADLSLGAAQRARERAERFGLPILAVVADAARLPLEDRSVDIALVHDGLHHLADPRAGLLELARVSRAAVAVIEPTRAVITSIGRRVGANRFGFALDVEEAGNPVHRLSPEEIELPLAARGFEVVRSERYGMLYRHEPGCFTRLLSRARLHSPAQQALSAINATVGGGGNKISVQARRRRELTSGARGRQTG